MKNLLLITAIFIVCSCNKGALDKSQVEEFSSSISTIVGHTIGDQSKTPNLYIPKEETGWAYHPSIGLYPGYKRVTQVGDSVDFGYSCYIANGIPNFFGLTFPFDYSGQKDFVVCRPCDGIRDQYSNAYNFPSMLSIKGYGGGEVISQLIKQQFFVGPNYNRVGFDFLQQIQYNWNRSDTMFIPWGCADNYFNTIRMKAGLEKYVVKIFVNPDSLIRECDTCYSDNISFLPVAISGTSVVVDTSALSVTPKAPNFLECKMQKGKIKGVFLKWDGNADAYCIERNGVMIIKWLYGSKQYSDATGTMNDSYRIISRLEYNRKLRGDSEIKKPSRK